MMVAAHPSDLRGAQNAGPRIAYVPRPGEYGDNDNGELESGEEFDMLAKDFNGLCCRARSGLKPVTSSGQKAECDRWKTERSER